MQTFLPYKDFNKCALVLDWKRLGKQRVETLQVLNAILIPEKGWKQHPATQMWKNHVLQLLDYQTAICNEWVRRGYRDTCLDKSKQVVSLYIDHVIQLQEKDDPWWLGDERLHSSHRSNLLRKDKVFYNQWNWSEPDDLPYFWPSDYVPDIEW
jgi:hypothetical protein